MKTMPDIASLISMPSGLAITLGQATFTCCGSLLYSRVTFYCTTQAGGGQDGSDLHRLKNVHRRKSDPKALC